MSMRTEEPPPPASTAGSKTPGGASAGRGVAFLSLSKGWFMVAGYAGVFGLTRLLPKEQYGIYAVVAGIVSILGDVLIRGTIQAVSRFAAGDPSRAESVKRAALRLQCLLGGGLFAAYYLLSPLIARFLHDPSLVGPLRVSSLIVLSYSFYPVYVGFLNGLRRFLLQASLDMTFSTMKLGLMLVFAAAGFGAAGALGGFGLAAFLILLVAMGFSPAVAPRGRFPLAPLFSFQLFIVVFTVLSNLLLKTDLLLLKRLSSPAEANTLAAFYAAAQQLAFIPYQAIVSVTFVIFPLVSGLTALGDAGRVRGYIREALRYSLMLTGLIAVLFSANAPATIRLLFPAGYEAGAGALSVLVFGVVFFSLFLVAATAISGSGRPGLSVLVGLGTLALDVLLNAWLIPVHGIRGAAVATTLAMAAGMCAAWGCLRLRFGPCLPILSAARVAAAGAAVYFASGLLPASGIYLAGSFAALAALYLLLLVALRELGAADLARVRKAAGLG
ncbi:MAG: oligosaccharide flippase family protein [Candidatus Aureabacteria bacterium]|nr:oligosaccharide flippase family protein [Candidatus Auribacterota bacterium]HOE26985.1 oligosaccharide flippase family protein [bacterium]HQM51758.1 oligosaccharide flippase family protein [bacterium]